MPRYFFDVLDGDEKAIDEEGIECESLSQMRYQAIDALPEIAREELPDGDERTFQIKVRDADGKHVFTCSLAFKSSWTNA